MNCSGKLPDASVLSTLNMTLRTLLLRLRGERRHAAVAHLVLGVPLLALSMPFVLSMNADAQPAETPLAATPPMGWNSWDSYGLTVREDEFRANADYLAKNLLALGWQYAVVDEGWYLTDPENAGKPAWKYTMDANGLYTPSIARFPSADGTQGFQALAAFVHRKGLRFGIHIIRGIPREAVDRNLPIAGSSFHAADAAERGETCSWNPDNYGLKENAEAQAYYTAMVANYAKWGVDLIKIDCISYPYHAGEIRMMQKAIRASGRQIVLSLSPGPAPIEKADELTQRAQMWRISGDMWDHWGPVAGMDWSQSVLGQFVIGGAWSRYAVPGHWPDADMLPIGYLGPRPGDGTARQSKLNHDEQRTLVTFWSMLRSPLFMGGDLTQMDPWTASLLTNKEVLAVNQHATGQHAILQANEVAVWSSQPEDKSGTYVALFNLSDQSKKMHYRPTELKLDPGTYSIRDLWTYQETTADAINLQLAPHASALLRLTRKRP